MTRSRRASARLAKSSRQPVTVTSTSVVSISCAPVMRQLAIVSRLKCAPWRSTLARSAPVSSASCRWRSWSLAPASEPRIRASSIVALARDRCQSAGCRSARRARCGPRLRARSRPAPAPVAPRRPSARRAAAGSGRRRRPRRDGESDERRARASCCHAQRGGGGPVGTAYVRQQAHPLDGGGRVLRWACSRTAGVRKRARPGAAVGGLRCQTQRAPARAAPRARKLRQTRASPARS